MLKKLSEEKAKYGPPKSRCVQTDAAKEASAAKSTSWKSNTTACLNEQFIDNSPSLFPVSVADDNETMTARGRADDGSDEAIFLRRSPNLPS